MTDFTVWIASESHSDGRRFSANYPQEAAEMFADWKDSYGDDYEIVNGHSETVIVRNESDGREYRMIVSGRLIRRYSARLVIEPMGAKS